MAIRFAVIDHGVQPPGPFTEKLLYGTGLTVSGVWLSLTAVTPELLQMDDVRVLLVCCPENADCMSVFRQVRVRAPDIPLIAIAETSPVSVDFALNCLKFGARGILQYSATPAEIEATVQLVLGGGLCYPKTLGDLFVHMLDLDLAKKWNLTPREEQVLWSTAANKCDKDIATELRIQEGTVHSHFQHIFRKMGVSRRKDAVRKYFELKSST